MNSVYASKSSGHEKEEKEVVWLAVQEPTYSDPATLYTIMLVFPLSVDDAIHCQKHTARSDVNFFVRT